MEPQLIFIRGLSTYGHDDAQLSFVKLGPVYRKLQRELKARGVAFHPLLGMGSGTLTQVAARAKSAITTLPVWQTERPVHLVGHSAGGLVARLLLHEFGDLTLPDGRPKIASVLTIATPHRGSKLADIFIEMPRRHRWSALFFRAVGYDVRDKREYFNEMTASAVADALTHVDEDRFVQTRLGSVVCAPERRRWSVPMRSFHKLGAFREFTMPSDGMVEADSQVFGRETFEVALDHFQQAGFFGAEPEFKRLGDIVAHFVRDA